MNASVGLRFGFTVRTIGHSDPHDVREIDTLSRPLPGIAKCFGVTGGFIERRLMD
jgi:hypothetical protein